MRFISWDGKGTWKEIWVTESVSREDEWYSSTPGNSAGWMQWKNEKQPWYEYRIIPKSGIHTRVKYSIVYWFIGESAGYRAEHQYICLNSNSFNSNCYLINIVRSDVKYFYFTVTEFCNITEFISDPLQGQNHFFRAL